MIKKIVCLHVSYREEVKYPCFIETLNEKLAPARLISLGKVQGKVELHYELEPNDVTISSFLMCIKEKLDNVGTGGPLDYLLGYENVEDFTEIFEKLEYVTNKLNLIAKEIDNKLG